jgi:hypothetical protein
MAAPWPAIIIDDNNYRNLDDPPEIKNINLVKEELKEFFNDSVDEFSTLLKNSNALLAGGSILSMITGAVVNDLDIYVSIDKLKYFVDGLKKIFDIKGYKLVESSKYCKSFLRKNSIKNVYTLADKKSNSIDIMSIRNNKTPLQVVNNFDLTICQTWYDGEHVYASHPDHIKNRAGVLQGEYVPLFIARNGFLTKRVRKYTKYRREKQRFKISLDTSVLSSIIIDNKTTASLCRDYKVDGSMFNNWFVSKLIKFIVTKKYSCKDIKYKLYSNAHYKFKETILEITDEDEYDSDNDEDKSANMLKVVENNYLADTALDIPTRFAHARHDFLYTIEKNMLTTPGLIATLQKYFSYTKAKVQRLCKCYISTTEEIVWDFHKHDLNKGISAEGLQDYLTSIMSTADRKNIPCYVDSCPETLKDYEIRSVLDDEFWERFSLKLDISPKVNTSAMDMILTNTATTTNAWNDVYHATLCPYCIAQENRSEGCAYMTHEVDRGVAKPYCKKYNLITEIKDKYIDACPRGGLQFCVTCGRPCCDHKHFNLDIINPRLIETVLDPAVDQPDDAYTKCMGGGRPELFARLLAIQKVISEQEFTSDFEQRKACALAALNAPNDPELMAKGKAIFEKDPGARGFANLGIVSEVPFTNDESNGENDVMSGLELGNNEEASNQEGGNKNTVSLHDLKKLLYISKRKTHKTRR